MAGVRDRPDGTGGLTARTLAAGYLDDCHTAAADDRVTWKHLVLADTWAAAAETDPVKLRARLTQLNRTVDSWISALDTRKT